METILGGNYRFQECMSKLIVRETRIQEEDDTAEKALEVTHNKDKLHFTNWG